MCFVSHWCFCANGFWRCVVIDCNVWWPRRVGIYAGRPLENDVDRFAGYSSVYSCRRYHGAGQNRLTVGAVS